MTDHHRRYADAIAPLYCRAFEEFGDDTHSLFVPKGRQTLRYTHMLAGLTFDSVLDVGCGIGLLKGFLDATGSRARYVGVDLVESMIELCRRKYPAGEFHRVDRADQADGHFDLVFLSGTFNIVPDGFSHDAYKEFVFDSLAALFRRARRYLVFDYMNEQVDFRQPRSLHLSRAEVIAFVSERLSRRFELLQHYMPYETTMRVFADAEIDRDRNVFHAAVSEPR